MANWKKDTFNQRRIVCVRLLVLWIIIIINTIDSGNLALETQQVEFASPKASEENTTNEQQQQNNTEAIDSVLYVFDDPALDFNRACPPEGPDEQQVTRLGDDCKLLRIFNQTELDLMEPNQEYQYAKHCACQLIAMRNLWTQTFDRDPSTRRLATVVKRAIENQINQRHPDYLWSDLDVTVEQISIYTATKDYFEQQSNNRSKLLRPQLRRELSRDDMWKLINKVCYQVAMDSNSLYRYAENLNRIDPVVFINLVTSVQHIDMVYTASKACKILLLPKLNEYKLKPSNTDLIPVYPSILTNPPDSENSVTNDIDLMLKDASALLLNCKTWQSKLKSPKELALECPMMTSEKVPTDWLIEHSNPLDRSQHAIRCGCQLLLHNATWATILKDNNVAVMSRTLTNYMNNNQVPDFTATPIWSIHGWFDSLISKLTKSRKLIIAEVIKTQSDNQDPTLPEQPLSYDALELLRRGCNYICFNHNKGSKEIIELKLIKYLDNLQRISQDDLFVFHLTLQDPNLFKLHALSKMCQPIIS